MAKKIAYVIARESADDRTLQNQYDNLIKIADEEGYKVIKKFGENVSGDVTKNDGADPQFINELREAIAQQKPDAIFCYWIDRLTRTTYKQGAYLEEFSAKPKIPIFFTRVRKWTINPQTGLIDNDFLNELASDTTPQKEREGIVARTRPQREKRGSEGYFIGHLADGYRVEESWGVYDDGRRKKIKEIKIDENRKDVIERIFKMYIEGNSLSRIAEMLNADGVPTTNHYRATNHLLFGHKLKYKGKDGIERERKNAKWTGSSIGAILSNAWYKGERTYKPAEGMLTHDPIVTKEVWDKVDSLRREKRISFRTEKISKHNFLLSNLIFCGRCGSKLYAHYTGLNNHYYCSSIETGKKCGLKGICKENIEAVVFDIIKAKAKVDIYSGEKSVFSDYFSLNPSEQKKIERRIKDNEKLKVKKEEEIKKLTVKMKMSARREIEEESNNNVDMANVYREETKEYEKSRREIEREIEGYDVENRQLRRKLSTEGNYKSILRNIEENRSLEDVKELIRAVVERIVLFNTESNNDVVRIFFKNGKQVEFIYSYSLLKNNYILLHEDFMYYDEKDNLLKGYSPLEISSAGVFPTEKEDVDAQDEIIIKDAFSVDWFIRTLRGFKREQEEQMKRVNEDYMESSKGITALAFLSIANYFNTDIKPIVRLEEKTEKAKEQEEHYRQWRKKYNTGNPSGKPYVLRGKTYDDICKERKKLYNRKWKIKKNKSLSKEEKEKQLIEIQKRLDYLSIMVPKLDQQ